MDVSILLLTKNAGPTLASLLATLHAQRTTLSYEIVAVDSGSTDRTLDTLREAGVRVVQIPPESFDHGTTRSLGVSHCVGRFVVLLVQDAVPASLQWLNALVAPLLADETVAASFARQIPREDATALARWAAARWITAETAPRVAALGSEAELAALPPAGRLWRCAFDNVCSCVRRAVWERHPFRPTPIAEDLAWAREVLLSGHKIAYAPEAEVVHSHDRTSRYELFRTYLIHQRLHALFGLTNIPDRRALAVAWARTLIEHLRRIGPPTPGILPWLREAARAVALAFAWPLGQYWGAKSARTGVDFLKPRGI